MFFDIQENTVQHLKIEYFISKICVFTSKISILTLGVAPGHFKYSSANTETLIPFCGARGGHAPPPSA